MTMGESELPGEEAEETEHPLKPGIDAAEEGDTASLEDVLSELD